MADSSRAHMFLTGESKVLELIATCAPIGETLDALCRLINDLSGLRSSVYLLDDAGRVLSLAAAPDLPAVDGLRAGARGRLHSRHGVRHHRAETDGAEAGGQRAGLCGSC